MPDEPIQPTTVPPSNQAAALLMAAGEGLALIDPQGRVVLSNPRFAELGADVQALIGTTCRQAVDATPREQQGPQRLSVTTPDGARVFELVVTPTEVGGSDGSVATHAAVVVRDVTASRRFQEKMDAIDAAGRELVRLDTDAIRKLNVVERLSLLETKIVHISRTLLHFDHFAIRLVDERTGKLEAIMVEGLPPEAAEIDLYPLREGNGISGYVAATGESYICGDTAADDRYIPGLVGARSSLTLPLRLHDRVIGIINVESQKPHAFTEEDRRFGEIFARYVALALNMLDLLVAERSSTNASVSTRVQTELTEPLDDILYEADRLLGSSGAALDPATAAHIERIRTDVASIRGRVASVAAGPQTLLGVERALAQREADPVLAGKRILVADDEPRIRRVIGDVLTHRGAETTVCDSGTAAIAALEAAGAGRGPRFDLIISDIRMPDRNGYEVFAAARKAIPGVPVVLMTGFGYDPHHSIVRASQDGLESVLFKPFEVERMLDVVRKALQGRAASP